MKKTLIATTAIAVALGFCGIANAGKDDTGNPGKGNQGCTVVIPNDGPDIIIFSKNPGQAVRQLIHENDGLPPSHAAKEAGTTLGALINAVCGDPS